MCKGSNNILYMIYLAYTFYKPTRAKGGYNGSYYIMPKRGPSMIPGWPILIP